MPITVSEHRELLIRVLTHYGLSPDCLEIVPDVQVWCKSNGFEEPGQWRVAKCFFLPRGFHIVMRDELTDERIDSLTVAIGLIGFEQEIDVLDSDEKFLLHLLLHQIGCYVLRTPDQFPRDQWAFNELSKHAA
jgi:hypothetical protein